MRRAVFLAPGTIEVEDVERPALAPGDVRLRVEACGVCGSDLATFFHGHYVTPPQVMGHEVVGTVVERGPAAAGVEPGTLVAVRPLRACGTCWYCRRGDRHLCGGSARSSIGYGAAGGFAEELVVAAAVAGRDVHPIDAGVPAADAVWAEPLAVALHALARGGVGAGTRMLVVGCGPVGLCAVAAAVAGGAVVTVVEPRAARREAALGLGAAAGLAPGEPLPPASVVVDAAGVPAALAEAYAAVRPGGTVVLLGLSDHALPAPPPGVRVLGSFAFADADFRRSVTLIERGDVRLGALVTHRLPLDGTAAAMRTAAGDESAVKVVVVPGAPA